DVPGFSSVGLHILARSTSPQSRWGYDARGGVQRVSDRAPMGLWPGAGDGHARAALLRAHPLLDDGAIDATHESAFGRTLASTSLEGQRWLAASSSLVRVGLAAFVDAARASRQAGGVDRPLTRVDAGIGLRMKLPASDRTLRIDVAHGLTDRAVALTFALY